MRAFDEVRIELGLLHYLDSTFGTLYFVPHPRVHDLIVRHFDRDVSPAMISTYVDAMQATRWWVEQHAAVNRLVSIEQPIEVGVDFVLRKYHLYYTSLHLYYGDWDGPPEPPDELEQMQNALFASVGRAKTFRDKVIESVLTRSLLEPTGKTYFSEGDSDDDAGRFVVVEPEIVTEDLVAWSSAA